MKFIARAVLVSSIASVSLHAENDPAASLRAWLGEQPGGVTLAIIDKSGTHFFAEGTFSRADARRPDENTLFEIGSLTKPFTALLLADAVRRGEVKLEDTIATRAGVKAPVEITFETLATQRSGLPPLAPRFAPANPRDPYADQDEAKLFAALADVKLREPGARYEYSNFGFAVLGQSLAKVIGKTYDDLLRERVLQPLAMESTTLDWRSVDAKRLAPPHTSGEHSTNWTQTAYAPAGALVSSTRDLARFAEIALGRRESPLGDALATCLDPRADMQPPTMRIGLAWIVQKLPSGATITWHNGGTGGYRSFLGVDRKMGVGVVLLTNHDTALDPLAFALLAGEEFRAPKIKPPVSELVPYLGKYPLLPSFVMTVTAEGTQLFLQATGQPRLTLKKSGEDRFAVVGVDASISFTRDNEGAVDALILHQNGLDQRAPRQMK